MKKIDIKDVKILAGNDYIAIKPSIPYNDLACDFLAELSKNLLANPIINQYSDIVSLAFWCRKANIKLLKDKFHSNDIRLGLGYIFHITPSNVPVNFAFSFFFGLLSGNANIVRIPSKDYTQTQIICEAINKLFQEEKYLHLKQTNAIISYEKNDEQTAYFSKHANGRIIWGGDNTINEIKQLPSHPRSVDLAFADRTSLTIINEAQIKSLNEQELNKVVDNFYNDTYFMDQNACSSPFLILWENVTNNNLGKKRFWEALNKKIETQYELELINSVDKYTLLCEQAIDIDNITEFNKYSSKLYVLNLNETNESIEDYRGKFGHFFEMDIDDLKRISHMINEKYQTLTYFGVDSQELAQFVLENSLLGIDRIVPIGQALNISTIWDGYDTIRSLSRVIEVK